MNRRHDIDALRALAFALLILYHLGMLYVADWGWHIKSAHQAEWLQWPMLFLNRWRMDLVFLVSGMAAAFLLKTDQVLRFLWLRHWRLVLPLVFGVLVVVPIQPYVQGVTNGAVAPGVLAFLHDYFSGKRWPEGAFDGWEHGYTWNHLWYLAYLWIYTLALALIAKPLASPLGKRLTGLMTGLRGGWLFVVPALPLFVFTVLLQARFPDRGDFFHDWYRNPMYFTAFLYGYVFARSDSFWTEASRLRYRSLGVALLSSGIYLTLVATLPNDVSDGMQALVWALRNLFVWNMLLTILGWAHTWLNRPFRWLPWANESVYPWYVLHQSLIVALAYWLAPLRLGPVAEPVVVLVGTIGGCFVLAEGIKRLRWLRPCFGLKRLPDTRSAPVTAAASWIGETKTGAWE